METERELLLEQAQNWLVRLTSGSATTDDAREYKRWCAQSAAHADAMSEVSRVWEVARQAGKSFGAVRQPAARIAPLGIARPGRRAFMGGALAAGAAAWLLVRPPGNMWPSLSDIAADYHTGTGEQHEFILNEQIQVALNTQTAANILPVDGRSALEVKSGEAQVDVPEKASFVVHAGGGQVAAQSAARFNVRVDGRQVCVTCLSGKVEVSYGARVLVATAAQQITYGQGAAVSTAAADISKLNAWRKGMLVFDNTSLASVVDEINRYRPGKIILTNDDLGRRRVQAQVRMDQLADVVGLIQASYGAKVTMLPAGIVVLS